MRIQMHVATQGCLRGTAARLNPPPPPPLALYFCLLLAPFCFLISFPGTLICFLKAVQVFGHLLVVPLSLCLSLPLSHFPPPFAWLQCRRPRRIPLLGPLRAFRFIWSRVAFPAPDGAAERKGDCESGFLLSLGFRDGNKHCRKAQLVMEYANDGYV